MSTFGVAPEEVVITGEDDVAGLTQELIDLVPDSWTSVEAKQPGGVFRTLMGAIGLMLASIKANTDILKLQFRLLTASGSTLDIISSDFFGKIAPIALPRQIGESDTAFRTRIQAEILQERATVIGIKSAVARVTGADPIILEAIDVTTNWSWTGSTVDGSSFVPFGTANSIQYPYNCAWGSYEPYNMSSFVQGVTLVQQPQTHLGVSGLSLWLKADAITGLTNGASVASWLSSAIGGGGATQSNGANQPTYVNPGWGTLPLVHFAANQFMTTGISLPANNTFSVFCVFMVDNGGATVNQSAVRTIAGSTTDFILGIRNGKYAVYDGANNLSGGRVSNTVTGQMVLVAAIATPTSVLTFLGSTIATAGMSDSVNSVVPGTLGLGIAAEQLIGSIGEVLVYNRAVTDLERQLITAYLFKKWGITDLYVYLPNPGLSGWGGSSGGPYNFFVFVAHNPKGAASSTILSVIQRAKPIGTQEHLFVSS